MVRLLDQLILVSRNRCATHMNSVKVGMATWIGGAPS